MYAAPLACCIPLTTDSFLATLIHWPFTDQWLPAKEGDFPLFPSRTQLVAYRGLLVVLPGRVEMASGLSPKTERKSKVPHYVGPTSYLSTSRSHYQSISATHRMLL